jgi:hypothetical protein
MHIRYRWYRFQLPPKSAELHRIFARRPLGPKDSFGFLDVGRDADSPKYRFLFRTTIVLQRSDEKGNMSYEEIANISFIDFAIVTVEKIQFLRVENPGRNVRDLMNALESTIGLGFTCKPVTFEKSRPEEIFKHVEEVRMVGMRSVDVTAGGDLMAKMEFTSSSGIEPEKVKALKGATYKVDFAVFSLLYEGIKGQMILASSGVARITGQLAPRILHFIEQDLPKLVSTE